MTQSVSRRSFLQFCSLAAAMFGFSQAHAQQPFQYSNKTRALMMSSSRYKTGGYLEHADPQFKALFGHHKYKNVVLVPYASVSATFDNLEGRARPAFERNGHVMKGIHHFSDPKEAIRKADAIAIAGGNTFVLLKRMMDAGIIDVIRERVMAGVPFVGWSAGGNVCNPTIRTTNDMPIAMLTSLRSLNLVPFQTNPHFISGKMPGHNGESREDRLNEFLAFNPKEELIAMPEGTAILVNGKEGTALGPEALLWFRQNNVVRKIEPNTKFALDMIRPE